MIRRAMEGDAGAYDDPYANAFDNAVENSSAYQDSSRLEMLE